MAYTNSDQILTTVIRDVAAKMLAAAKTAPKARGKDSLILGLLEGDDILRVADRMRQIGSQDSLPTFTRDAAGIAAAPVVVLLGTRIQVIGLKRCGWCGFENCADKNSRAKTPCVFNTGDLGIAIGSAVSVAMDHRIDNRIMYSAGQVAVEMGFLGPDAAIAYAIPLSATSKNPFFDRPS